ncbi:hypothetical protein L202_07484 [Cryptococcus amylolentus CBS 6039]|uniref:Uncharacterized protein n=2 Tax=Cryptococcus amylolentus TaxID=104669 RepID=A0A1E3HEY3_9TREE|nr:hypothetical protein L202_07484 [Cryptococcus amylolentus CBS 6039]ODN73991.1 hypothetical protein L202_07484 [Cryptococcus amylolentus CBS 6039]ODO00188.1 hypothetical protein I350_06813 [Cryptococcus amylolentus CBS 6273]
MAAVTSASAYPPLASSTSPLDYGYTSSVSPPLQGQDGRVTTPLAAPPPPPLHMSSHRHVPGPERQIRYAGADHTLGPTFSEEEDGDDSAFIAAKMAALGLDPNGNPYNQNGYSGATRAPKERRSRTPVVSRNHEPVNYQQQQVLINLLSQQASPSHIREAMALLELQQAQHAATDRHYQTQMLAQQHARSAAQRQAEEYQRDLYIQQQAQKREMERLAIQREATKRQFLQQQQEQQMLKLRDQRLQQLHLQQQLAALQTDAYQAQVQAQRQRSALGAQMTANLQARQDRAAQGCWAMGMDSADLQSRFESAPQSAISPTSEDRGRFESAAYYSGYEAPSAVSGSPTSPSWRSSESSSPTKSVSAEGPVPAVKPGGRFARARAALEADGKSSYGTLSAALSKRSSSEDHTSAPAEVSIPPADGSHTTPASPISERIPIALGIGRPVVAPPKIIYSGEKYTPRAFSLPQGALGGRGAQAEGRSASLPAGQVKRVVVTVARQPTGPPGDVKDLGDKNFQARIRSQAVRNLGMLGRRTDSPANDLVVV